MKKIKLNQNVKQIYSVHEFETLKGAEEFAENMKHLRYKAFIAAVMDIKADEEPRYNKL